MTSENLVATRTDPAGKSEKRENYNRGRLMVQHCLVTLPLPAAARGPGQDPEGARETGMIA